MLDKCISKKLFADILMIFCSTIFVEGILSIVIYPSIKRDDQ